ncbi:MAG TPA: sodium:solute symporter family protein, partial [Vicinamibacteria bacterium]|nr:sodium:solute symporter family protein [Vicinamibacteria bacterium]
ARSQKTSADFWVANRAIGLPVLVMANVAAIMHGGSILSGVALMGSVGGVAGLPYIAFAGGFAVIFFSFAKRLRNSGGFTLPDYMGDRFDSRFLRGWSALMVALSSVIYLIAQIRGMGFILESLLGIPFFWGLFLGTVIFVFYVALGGLLAVIWTNIAQFVFMWAGLLILLPYVHEAVGGWYDVIDRVEAVAPGWTSVRGTSWSLGYLLSWNVIWFVAYCTRVELITKMYAARDHKIARRSLPWTILITLAFLLYGNFYIGGAARVLVWDSISAPDQAFPTLVSTLLPPILAALALTGIASAAMSTTDSLLLMSGAAIAHDFLRKCFHEPNGIQRDESYYLRASRITIVAVGLVAFLGAIPEIDLILQIVSYAIAIVGATFFFPLIVGLTSSRLSKQAAIASSVGGSFVTIAWTWARLDGATWAQDLHPGVMGLATAGILMFIVGLVTRPVSPRAVSKFFPEAS